jgi:hypothetical protein
MAVSPKPTPTLNLGLRWELHTPGTRSETGSPTSISRAARNIYPARPAPGTIATRFITSTTASPTFSRESASPGLLAINPPFAVEHDNQYSGSGNYKTLPGSTLDQGFTPFVGNAGDQFQSVTLRVWDPNIRPAVAHQWNLTIQRQFTPSTTISAAYVGQRSTHLIVPMPYFQKVLHPEIRRFQPISARSPEPLPSATRITMRCRSACRSA